MPAAWASYFLLFLSTAIFVPYLQLYLKARGFSPSQIGILLACLELAGLLGPILLGRLADRHARYRGLFALSLVVTVAAFAPLQLTSRFLWFALGLGVMGFAYRSTTPLLDSLVGKTLTDPTRQYGLLRVAGSFAFIAVSVVLQFTSLSTGKSSVGILVAFSAAALVALAAVPFLVPAGRDGSAQARVAPNGAAAVDSAVLSMRQSGFTPAFWIVMGIIFLGRFGIGSYYSFFSLYLQQTFPGVGISLLWAIGPVAEVVAMYFSGRLIARRGIRFMLVLSLASISVRLSLFVIAPSIGVVAGAQLLHAFTFGTFHTTAIAYINSTIARERRGLGMALYTTCGVGLPSLLASLVGGFVLQAHGFAVLFLSYAVAPVIGIALLTVLGARLLPRPTAAQGRGPGAVTRSAVNG